MVMRFYCREEAAAILGISVAEVDTLREERKLCAYRDGAEWKFKADDVEQLARQLRSRPNSLPTDVHGADAPDIQSKRCIYCNREPCADELFCSRCGGIVRPESAEEKLLYRLEVIGRLVRNHVSDGASGAYSIQFEVNAAKVLVQTDAGLLEGAGCRLIGSKLSWGQWNDRRFWHGESK
jgi:excisionase family DNA binding protein